MNDQELLNAIAEAKKGEKRGFKQSLDLVVNLQNVDLKNPANKIDLKIQLPEGRGREIRIGVFGDPDFLKKAVGADVKLSEGDIRKDLKSIRKIVKKVDFFIAQTNLMVEIGKTWGKLLGGRGKMPLPLPPGADPSPVIARLKKTVVLRCRGKTPLTIHCAFGTEDMDDAKLQANLNAVLGALLEKLPNKMQNISSAYIKTTMGPSIKII